jgi:hypothetical protein
MWGLFIGWIFTRSNIRRTDLLYFGRRLAYVACACCFAMGLLGVGLFTSVPATTLTFLLTGWFVVREVRSAATAETATLNSSQVKTGTADRLSVPVARDLA